MHIRPSLGCGSLLGGLALASTLGAATASAGPATHDLMPSPERLEWLTGRLVIDTRFTVASIGAREPRIEAAVSRAGERLAAATGLRIAARAGAAPKATLVLEAGGSGLPVQTVQEDESYTLTVTPQQARIKAPTPIGILHGLETFLQLVRSDGGRHVVPAVTISDRPRFPWRGLLIDPCRRWQPLEVIKRNLDAMAAVKMNVLHWHLTEDQGFRIESKRFPKLHERGSEGLFYTQDQVRDVIAYARLRGIRVVPEFDIPGHSTSWLVGHPELGSAPGPFALVRTWGIFDNNLDPTRDEVYAFLDGFLGEMAALFPDAYLHIGGDEVSPRQWNESSAILDYLYRHELNDAADLQAHFNLRVNEILGRHGKRMVGWDEILRPELPRSIVVHSWRGAEALARAATLGYDGILSSGYYLDHMLTAATHYLADPIPPDSPLPAEARAHILGGEACMWGEFVSPEVIDSRIWPRTAAVAERLWSPVGVRDVEDMYRRLEIQDVRLDAAGVQHRSSYLPRLKRLAGAGPVEPLMLLADLVEPVKMYARGHLARYTTTTPLERLVDVARPDSVGARAFRREVDRFLSVPLAARKAEPLSAVLSGWRDNHRVLEPILSASPVAAEARSLSRDLAALGQLGLQAVDAIEAGRQAPDTWRDEARRTIDHARKPRAELELAVIPAVRKLVLAAGQLDELKTLSLEEWNRKLETQLASPPDARH